MNKTFALGLLLAGACLLAQTQTWAQAQPLPVPTSVQLHWQQMETTAFIHFSVNTYTDMEWGYGNESPLIFNPTKLDCRQWIRTCKEAGLKGVILTAKHHDGFCLWPSAYTEYSVKNSPWKEGKGDLVREFVDACHEYGLKVGLYLSPWDCNHPDYGKPEYITYFRNQLRELLTNYGELYEFWFDGANGGRGYYGTDSLHTRKIAADYYPWASLTKMVYELQPNCVVHGGDLANIRWVGNEEGYAQEEHWSAMREPKLYDKEIQKRFQWMRGHADGTIWMPSEVDVSVRPGWYYHASEDHKLKSLSKLIDIYYESVGRNSLLLLNLTPHKEGLISSQDSLRLVEWYQRYTSELSNNLVHQKMKVSGDTNGKMKNALDSNRETFWKAEIKTPVFEVDFGKELSFNRLLLQEWIEKGQRVKRFIVEYNKDGKWQQLDEQTTIGYKRILRFPEVKASRLRIRITDAWAAPRLAEIQVFRADTPVDAPVITRNKKGEVKLTCNNKQALIHYTTDGKNPVPGINPVYQSSFLADGDLIMKAIAVDGEKNSSIAIRSFKGSRATWSTKPENAGTLIFDEDANTTWVGKGALEIDLQSVRRINGLKYLPDQARWANGIVEKYAIEISIDGNQWQEVTRGEFSNIQNNPIERQVDFLQEQKARYIRFRALSTVGNQNHLGVAEFDVLFSND